jgi:hypothetical protein
LIFSSSSELEEFSLEKSKSHSRHDLLELLLIIIIFEEVLLLVVALIARVVLSGAVILVGGVELVSLGAIGNEVSGVATLEAVPG